MRPGAASYHRPCSARRAMAIPSLLARRASQHSIGRECGDLHRNRSGGGKDLQHPCRRRRHHATQPCTSGDRGTIRHARVALPGRIDLALGRAPGSDQFTAGRSGGTSQRCQLVSAGRARADHLFQGAAGADGESHSRRRVEYPDLDPRLQPVRRAAGGRARAAVRGSRRISPRLSWCRPSRCIVRGSVLRNFSTACTRCSASTSWRPRPTMRRTACLRRISRRS